MNSPRIRPPLPTASLRGLSVSEKKMGKVTSTVVSLFRGIGATSSDISPFFQSQPRPAVPVLAIILICALISRSLV